MPLPMPRLAPVTTATRPSSRRSVRCLASSSTARHHGAMVDEEQAKGGFADPEPVETELARSPEEAVRAANAAFYAAFESRDLDAMSAVREHSDRATATHPGWPPLRGWA